MRRAPLVPVALATIAGIATSHWCGSVGAWVWALMAAAVACTVGIILLASKQGYRIASWAALPFCFALAATTYSATYARHWQHYCHKADYITVRLADSPQIMAKSTRVMVQVQSVGKQPCSGSLTVYLGNSPLAAQMRYGDRLLLRGTPDIGRNSIYVAAGRYALLSRSKPTLRYRCEQLRMHLLHRMQRGTLDRRYAAVAEALTLGYRANIDTTTRTAYRDAGIAHLLAVSGLHVGLLAAIVRLLMIWAGRERRGRAICGIAQIVAIWLFALVSGLAASTLRACIMFSLFALADISGRNTSRLNILAVTATLTLLVNPMLLFDTGWQLSYSAVAGIIMCRPFIAAFNNRLWQSASVSVAATTATLPITMLTFHCIQPYFLVANIVVVPLAGVILFLSIAYMLVPCNITATPLEWLLRWVEAVTQWVSGLPYAVVELTP